MRINSKTYQFNYPRKDRFILNKKDSSPLFTFRGWQKDHYNNLKNHNYTITNVFTGGGKSVGIISLLLNEAKTIISVPQSQIGYGFCGVGPGNYNPFQFKGINGSYYVEPDNRLFLYQNISDLSKAKDLLSKIRNDNKFNIVCTHATLINLFKFLSKFSKRDRNLLIKDIHFCIDEAHHISNTKNEENSLAQVVNTIIECGSAIHLLTATFFRGDKLPILKDEHNSLFKVFRPNFVDILKTYRSFNKFSFDYVLQEKCLSGRYVNSIIECVKDFKKTIIFIPGVNSNYSSGDKYKEAESIIRKLTGSRAKIVEDENGVITMWSNVYNREIKIIDLVNEDSRKAKKSYISDGINIDVDFIIALNMMKEGANWTHAERAVICGWRNSVVEILQIIGRVLRDLPDGKKSPEIIQILDKPDGRSEEEFSAHVNMGLSVIVSGLIMDTLFTSNKFKNLEGLSEEKMRGMFEEVAKAAILSSGKEFKSKANDILKNFGVECVNLNLLYKDIRGGLVKFVGDLDSDKLERSMEILRQRDKLNLESHILFSKENKITTLNQWKNFKNRPSNLWSLVKGSHPFSIYEIKQILPKYKTKDKASIEEHLDFINKNKLYSINFFYKENKPSNFYINPLDVSSYREDILKALTNNRPSQEEKRIRQKIKLKEWRDKNYDRVKQMNKDYFVKNKTKILNQRKNKK